MKWSCEVCGSTLNSSRNKNLMDSDNPVCGYCGHSIKITHKNVDWDELVRAAEYRNDGLFEEAYKIYHRCLLENEGNYQARWGRLLCKYGVSYIERENSDRVITCRVRVDSEFLEENDYRFVCEMVSGEERRQYQKDGKTISDIQKKIRNLEKVDYDIFICYKETESEYNQTTTRDSVEANYIYDILSGGDNGYKVFYAKKSLKGKAGADYEAEIYNAISKSKVMLVIGSKEEYLTSTWVKSEWTRFLKEREKNPAKVLIPMLQRISPSQLPQEIRKLKLQAIDMEEDGKNKYKQLKSNLRDIFSTEQIAVTTYTSQDDPRVDEVILLLDEGKFDEGKKRFEMLAREGNADACFYLGSVYYNEDNNMTEAVRWFKKAARNGHPDAIFQLAFMYEFGIGMPKNKDKAEKWYARIADRKKEYPLP